MLRQLEHWLRPVTVFAVVPLFAAANAGVDLSGGADIAVDSFLGWVLDVVK
ncbi:MAG: Na+/H+ antiporter NhaA [Actinomycetota bacterium]|jgi:Na+/H+ antiporter NhaA|nr:Na+/H+ antiporter NhaA [Actinomycetota bacterium]